MSRTRKAFIALLVLTIAVGIRLYAPGIAHAGSSGTYCYSDGCVAINDPNDSYWTTQAANGAYSSAQQLLTAAEYAIAGEVTNGTGSGTATFGPNSTFTSVDCTNGVTFTLVPNNPPQSPPTPPSPPCNASAGSACTVYNVCGKAVQSTIACYGGCTMPHNADNSCAAPSIKLSGLTCTSKRYANSQGTVFDYQFSGTFTAVNARYCNGSSSGYSYNPPTDSGAPGSVSGSQGTVISRGQFSAALSATGYGYDYPRYTGFYPSGGQVYCSDPYRSQGRSTSTSFTKQQLEQAAQSCTNVIDPFPPPANPNACSAASSGTLTAAPDRVASASDAVKFTWDLQNIAPTESCKLMEQGSASSAADLSKSTSCSTDLTGSASLSGIAHQTTFYISCHNSPVSGASVIINVTGGYSVF